MNTRSMFKKITQIKALSLICMCLNISIALADHSEDHHVPLPFFVDSSNPLSTLTIKGTSTNVLQGYPSFYDPTHENNVNKGNIQGGTKTNLYLGMNLWEGAAVYANPEIMYGYNVGDNIGLVNLVNIATARVESQSPYIRMQRLFLQQEIDLGGGKVENEPLSSRNIELESLQNQLRGKTSSNYIRITLGKFGVGDIFDDNIYAHDPNVHFLNLAFNTLDSIDYAGDPWGLTYGAAIEWVKDWWAIRAGIFQGALPPPSFNFDPKPLNQYMAITEVAVNHDKFFGQPGSIKLIAYQDNGYINNIGDVNQFNYSPEYPIFVKNNIRRTKMGLGLNIQQQLYENIGFFLRAGIDNNAFDFRDSTKSISGGLVLDGKMWKRPLDEIGLGLSYSGLKRAYGITESGVVGFMGDGSLNYAPEKHLESYYRWNINKNFDLTFDYQLVKNPDYNKSRGNVHVFGLRLRANF